MRIYLASRYSRRDELQGYAAQLKAAGHVVTSRWIYGTHEIVDGRSRESAHEDRIIFAQEDVADVHSADAVISFTEGPGAVNGRGRGGRHVEFGIALALGRRCIVVGHRENIFHSLPAVEFYGSWSQAMDGLGGGDSHE